MPEIVNFHTLRDHPKLLFCEMLAGKKYDALVAETDPSKFEVCLTINGVEVPFIKTLERVLVIHEDAVTHRATELLQDKCGQIQETLEQLSSVAYDLVRGVLPYAQ